MTTEICEAIFVDGTWGPTPKGVLKRLEKGESVNAEELNVLGVNILGLDRITDGESETIILSKDGEKLHFETLISGFDDVSFRLVWGKDIGVRKVGKMKEEVMGIQVVRE